MGEPTRYPLAWPAHRPRTKNPKGAQFSIRKVNSRGWSESERLTVPQAMDRLEAEVSRIGGIYPLLSSNVETRLDGRPRGGAAEPSDSGVCLYFQLKGQPIALACDTYDRVADNIAALAKHLEATRAIERYGVATAAETLQAFSALPPPSAEPPPRPWPEVFGVMESTADEEMIGTLYRVLAKRRAADEVGLRELNMARDRALVDIRARQTT